MHFLYNEGLPFTDYLFKYCYSQVPLLVPGVEYPFETMIRNISELALSDQVRVLVVKEGQSQPSLAAIINMPVCDLLGMV